MDLTTLWYTQDEYNFFYNKYFFFFFSLTTFILKLFTSSACELNIPTMLQICSSDLVIQLLIIPQAPRGPILVIINLFTAEQICWVCSLNYSLLINTGKETKDKEKYEMKIKKKM